ncbi:MAG: hypothetical protein PHI79_03460 [Sulfurovaceae bacterium]|nr:hypothetical protein [Sulfurovaceae bacterium]
MRLFLFVMLLAVSLQANPRCHNYIQNVRVAHYEQFGVDFPYQYGVAQLQQESNCRDVISLDGVGSQGLPQITYRLWQKTLSSKGVDNIKSIPNQLKAQAIIMKSLHNPKYGLWVTYQVYNGGGLVVKEINRAGIESWDKAKKNCHRGKSCFRFKGQVQCRSNCDINYEYSKNIYKYGNLYGSAKTTKYRFW